ncbi:hypothetical protein H8N03_06540 [Ramlibacter sp. USB13]|uniref:Uncharacterized protein n=1 Tax=Ramlibacter cellulosilyticus TaxID=2764187 RepID=A0A923MPQ9_9BURK|nr:hypothetical protein [Ramlibacter cellulosilyticus]MBC5782596.1 hypothetical protein [Ramlibacter cellulosilyticus]
MTHTLHHPTHWLGVAVVLAMGCLAFEAIGQQPTNNLNPNAAAVFQGRPAMSGAQAGLGAMAGPPQGGLGLQGSDGSGMNLRRPRIIEEQMAQAPAPVACPEVPRISAAEQPLCLPQVFDEGLERRFARLGIDPQQRGRM